MNVAAFFLGLPASFIVASFAHLHAQLPPAGAIAVGLALGFACGSALLRAIKGSAPQRH